jgi:hypothetical protein
LSKLRARRGLLEVFVTASLRRGRGALVRHARVLGAEDQQILNADVAPVSGVVPWLPHFIDWR